MIFILISFFSATVGFFVGYLLSKKNKSKSLLPNPQLSDVKKSFHRLSSWLDSTVSMPWHKNVSKVLHHLPHLVPINETYHYNLIGLDKQCAKSINALSPWFGSSVNWYKPMPISTPSPTLSCVYLPNLTKVIKTSDITVIGNPYHSVFLVLKNSILQELSTLTKNILLLAFFYHPSDLLIRWGPSFSEEEPLLGGTIRWFHGELSQESIHLYNNTESSIDVMIRFSTWFIETPKGSIHILTDHENFSFPAKHDALIEFKISLFPGKNDINFCFPEIFSSIKTNDPRSLRVGITNFSILKSSPSDEPLAISTTSFDEIYLSDVFIRCQLHSHGFFEVTSFQSLEKQAIPEKILTTRVHIEKHYYKLLPSEKLDPRRSIRWYIAYRSPQIKEEVAHE